MLLQLKQVSLSFAGNTVLYDVNFGVDAGRIHSLIGPNGAGKTSMFNVITGFYRPQQGEITLDGEPIVKRKPHAVTRLGIARTFQNVRLFREMSVRENVMAPMREHTDFSRELMTELADLKIRLSGLPSDAANKRPSELSGGMRKRAALARALALDPELIFLDEPTAGLDPITAGRFDSLVRQLSELLGLTVFLVTHDLDTLSATCDRIAVLGDKRVKHIGPLSEVARIDDPWIEEYFSGPRGRAVV